MPTATGPAAIFSHIQGLARLGIHQRIQAPQARHLVTAQPDEEMFLDHYGVSKSVHDLRNYLM